MRGARGVFRTGLMLRAATRVERWPGLGFVFIMIGEYRRATLAAQRYAELRRMSPTMLVRMGAFPPDPPRRVFDEIYSAGNDAKGGAAWRASSSWGRCRCCTHSHT